MKAPEDQEPWWRARAVPEGLTREESEDQEPRRTAEGKDHEGSGGWSGLRAEKERAGDSGTSVSTGLGPWNIEPSSLPVVKTTSGEIAVDATSSGKVAVILSASVGDAVIRTSSGNAAPKFLPTLQQCSQQHFWSPH